MGLSPGDATGDWRVAAPAEAEAARARQILVRLLAPVSIGTVAELADKLIKRYGSLQAVLSADPLGRATFLVDDPAAAEQLAIVQEAMQQATLAAISANPLFPNTLAAADYLMVRLAAEKSEQIRAMYLDSRHMLISDECVTRGSASHAPVFPREILRRALELGATSLILAHNHPSGDTTPSSADIAVTRALIEGGRTVEVRVLDHLIVSRSGCRSLLAEGLLP
jgi:DNA repair protein RadC